MTNLHHYDDWGTARFITFSTNGRPPLLTSPGISEQVLREVGAARRKYKFRLHGFVIMPEHVHLVLYPAEPLELGRLIGEIKSRSARTALRALESTASPYLRVLSSRRNNNADYSFWLPRCYDHNCRSTTDTIEKVNYCHWNPVKRELVASPSAWPWSSYGSYFEGVSTPIEIDCIEL